MNVSIPKQIINLQNQIDRLKTLYTDSEAEWPNIKDEYWLQVIELQKQVDELKVACLEDELEWPESCDDYWSYYSNGILFCEPWRNSADDKRRKANYIIFRSMEEAEFSIQQAKAYRMLWNMADGDSWTIFKCKSGYEYTQRMCNYGVPKFSTEEKAQAAIDEIGEELLDTIFKQEHKQ